MDLNQPQVLLILFPEHRFPDKPVFDPIAFGFGSIVFQVDHDSHINHYASLKLCLHMSAMYPHRDDICEWKYFKLGHFNNILIDLCQWKWASLAYQYIA